MGSFLFTLIKQENVLSTNNDAAILIKLKRIYEVARDILSSDFSAEKKYSLIFSNKISRQVYNLFGESSITFNYYDPDASYEEDYDVFVDALDDHIQQLEDYVTSDYTDDTVSSDLMNRYNDL